MAGESRLDAFRRNVSWNLACGALADVDLPVIGDDGGNPVVVALDEEPISLLLGRLRAVGGYANLFVLRADNSVSTVQVVDERCGSVFQTTISFVLPARPRPSECFWITLSTTRMAGSCQW